MSDNQPQVGTVDPFSKGYKHRHGEPVSDACGDGKHSKCAQELTKCHCTYRGGHTVMHAYANAPIPQPTPAEPRIDWNPEVEEYRKLLMERYSDRCSMEKIAGAAYILAGAEPRIETVPDEQAAFEKWCLSTLESWLAALPQIMLREIVDGDVRYKSGAIQAKWEGWQGRARFEILAERKAYGLAIMEIANLLLQPTPIAEFVKKTADIISGLASPPSSPGAAQTCPTCKSSNKGLRGTATFRPNLGDWRENLKQDPRFVCNSSWHGSPGAPQEQK